MRLDSVAALRRMRVVFAVSDNNLPSPTVAIVGGHRGGGARDLFEFGSLEYSQGDEVGTRGRLPQLTDECHHR